MKKTNLSWVGALLVFALLLWCTAATPGTIADPARTAIQLNKYVKEAPFTDPEQSAFMSNIHMLKDDPNFEV